VAAAAVAAAPAVAADPPSEVENEETSSVLFTFYVFHYGSNAAEKNSIVFSNPKLKITGEIVFLFSYNYNHWGLKGTRMSVHKIKTKMVKSLFLTATPSSTERKIF
jgi:hypothetical protein